MSRVQVVRVFAAILFAALILAILSYAGYGDLDHAMEQADQYCENVHNGIWPDFKGHYDKYCDEGVWNGR